jgi:hypothetical protein
MRVNECDGCEVVVVRKRVESGRRKCAKSKRGASYDQNKRCPANWVFAAVLIGFRRWGGGASASRGQREGQLRKERKPPHFVETPRTPAVESNHLPESQYEQKLAESEIRPTSRSSNFLERFTSGAAVLRRSILTVE